MREARADVLLSSFDPLLLAMAGAVDPRRVPRALLTHAKQARWADVLAATVRAPVVQAVHIERTLAGPRVGRYLLKGLRVGALTGQRSARGARARGRRASPRSSPTTPGR